MFWFTPDTLWRTSWCRIASLIAHSANLVDRSIFGLEKRRNYQLYYIGPVQSKNVSLKIVPDLSWDLLLAHLDKVQGDPTWDQDWANPNKDIYIMSSRNDIPLMNTKTFYVKG